MKKFKKLISCFLCALLLFNSSVGLVSAIENDGISDSSNSVALDSDSDSDSDGDGISDEVEKLEGTYIPTTDSETPTALPPPTEFKATNVSDTSITVTWDVTSTPGQMGWHLYLDGVKKGSTGTYGNFIFTGLSPNTTYTLGIATYDNDTSVGPMTTIEVTTSNGTSPPAPSGVTYVTQNDDGSDTFSWNAVSGATSYDIYVNGNYIASTTATNYTIQGMKSGANHIGIVAVDADGRSSMTYYNLTGGQNTISSEVPPIGLSVSNTTTTSISLDWNSVPGADEFELRKNGGLVTTVPNTTTEYTYSGLSSGTTYELQVDVIPINGMSEGSFSIEATTLSTAPSAPTGLMVSDVTQNSATLSWNAVSGATSYEVYKNGTKVTDVTGTSYTFTGLTANTTYTLGVKAKNSSGTSALATIDVTTLPNAPGTPTGLSVSNITQTGVTLSWNAVSGATSYEVYKNGTKVTDVTGTSYTFTGLTANTTYTLGVKAKNSGGTSALATISVTTLANAPATPTGLSVSNITQTGATVSWTASSGATSYDVYVNDVLKGNTTSTSYNVTGLTANTSYTVEVVAKNSGGSSTPASKTFTTLPNPPASPTGLVTSNVTQTGATLSWTATSGATSYDVYLNDVFKANVGTTSYTFTGLASNTTYELSVVAKNSGGTSAMTTINVTTLPNAPSIPTGLTTSNVTQTGFTVSWTEVSEATSYDVYVDGTLKGNSTTTSYEVTGVSSGVSHKVEVVAKNEGGSSGKSTAVYALTIPANPGGLTVPPKNADKVYQTSIPLSWTPVTGATSYDVYLNGAYIANTTSTSYTFTGLQPNGVYDLGVKAKNASGSSALVEATVQMAPPTQTNVYVSDITQTSLTINWEPSPGATEYAVQILDENGQSIELVYDLPSTATSYTFTGLTPGTNYTVGTDCSNSGGYDSTAVWIDTSTLPNAPGTPTGLATSNVTQTGFTLSWTASSGATSYKIFVDGMEVATTSTTSFNITGLTPNTSYDVQVQAINSGGSSPMSSVLEVTTLPNAPTTPTGLTTSNITQTGATLSWNSVSNADSYDLYLSGTPVATDVTSTSYTFSSLTAETDYTLGVTAQNASGPSPMATVDIKTLPIAPAMPTDIYVDDITYNTITISWTNVSGADNYKVYKDGVWVETIPATTTSYTITGLYPNTTYTLEVEAVNEGGASEKKSVSATTEVPVQFNTISTNITDSIVYDSKSPFIEMGDFTLNVYAQIVDWQIQVEATPLTQVGGSGKVLPSGLKLTDTVISGGTGSFTTVQDGTIIDSGSAITLNSATGSSESTYTISSKIGYQMPTDHEFVDDGQTSATYETTLTFTSVSAP